MEACMSRFTAAEGGARLAAAARMRNTLAADHTAFIATRLLHEDAHNIRGSLYDGNQRSIYVTRASRVQCVAYDLRILTDLSVISALTYEEVYDWSAELDKKEVVVCTSEVIKQILENEILTMENINVLIIDSCHLICKDGHLKYIMKLYKEAKEDRRPRILALTYPLFNSPKKDNSPDESDTTCSDNEKSENSDGKTENTDDISVIKDEDSEKKQEISEELRNTSDNPDSNYKEINGEKNSEQMTVESTDAKDNIDLSDKENDRNEGGTCVSSETSVVNKLGVHENLDDFDMYEKLEWKIDVLEQELCCHADLAEDIDGVKRLSAIVIKPKELVIEYSSQPDASALPESYIDVERYMRDTVSDAMDFLQEHRYDPTEIYGEDLYEELKGIPDPTLDPKHMFHQFLYVLDQLGPYGADKAAFALLRKLEKLKIKVPYERHFLLLCLCTSVFIKIRCYADLIFSQHESDWEKIKLFCTPKVLRFVEILEKFKPPSDDKNETQPVEAKSSETDSQNNKDRTAKMIDDLEGCDFITLSNKIEDKVNSFLTNLKDIPEESATSNEKIVTEIDNHVSDKPISENINHVSEDDKSVANIHNHISDENVNQVSDSDKQVIDSDNQVSDSDKLVSESDKSTSVSDSDRNVQCATGDVKTSVGFCRRAGHRPRGRGRVPRSNASRLLQMQQNPDALCGIVFMKEALMADILFSFVVELSRNHPNLGFLCGQYSALEKLADPVKEPREFEQQRKKQEEVLKKFRMHECNLLLATSALEEGIDLPRCNLVLRWDVPASYRSYGLCRGRARAPRSTCVIMSQAVDDSTDKLIHNVATYKELDQIVSRKCGCGAQDEPTQAEEDQADYYTTIVKPYAPSPSKDAKNNIKPHQNVARNNSDNSVHDRNKIDNSPSESSNDKILCDNSNSVFHIEQKFSDSLISEQNNYINSNDNSLEQNNDNSISFTSDNSVQTIDNVNCYKCNKKRKTEDAGSECISEFCKGISDLRTSENKSDKSPGCDNKSDNFDASVDLSTAIALINRYCGKLPSDTFTRLAPQWWIEEVDLPVRSSPGETRQAFICTLRLPLNCPVKYNIVGHPMPTRTLARRMVALQACRILHKSGELDNQLMPIGKENFKAAEIELSSFTGNEECDQHDLARPGTTKRRQYYFKRTAWAFTDCQPIVDTSDAEIDNPDLKQNTSADADGKGKDKTGTKRNLLYGIVSSLCCALPERYNTRGRKLHAPQNASHALGILMARENHDDINIPAFPVYTRSGEVRVSVQYIPDADVRISPKRGRLVRRFMRFVFSDVLRVRRRGMKLQSEGTTHNNYYIVPTVRTLNSDGSSKIDIDWSFLELIYQHTEQNKLSAVDKPLLWQLDDEERDETTKDDTENTNDNEQHCNSTDDLDRLGNNTNSTNEQSKGKITTEELGKNTNEHVNDALCEYINDANGININDVNGTNSNHKDVPGIIANDKDALGKVEIKKNKLCINDNLKLCKVDGDKHEINDIDKNAITDDDMRVECDESAKTNIKEPDKTANDTSKRVIDRNSSKTRDCNEMEPTNDLTKEQNDDALTLNDIEDGSIEKKNFKCNKVKKNFGKGKHKNGKVVKKMDNPLLKPGEVFVFDPEKYREAVVTPWYRNQDQPQFFLVAEICWSLSPESAFPSNSHPTFSSYYCSKYGVQVTQAEQPLLDVDHTSARLNLLTPRYVNRKGVALPVSSERTRRAKRDRLDQKQILVAELCAVHPFAAPLWSATVALPCVLYRINALLIADEIRRTVAIDVGLGIPKINQTTCPRFHWPPLDFGWSLAEVLNADPDKNEKKKVDGDISQKEEANRLNTEGVQKNTEDEQNAEVKEKTINDILAEKEDAESGFEIGTWSNEMASSIPQSEYDQMMEPLPPNLTFCTSASGGTNWCDPVKPQPSRFNPSRAFSMADSDCSYMSSDFDTDDSDLNSDGSDEDTDSGGFCNSHNTNAAMGVRIEYKTAHEAEAVDVERKKRATLAPEPDVGDDARDRREQDGYMRAGDAPREYIQKFRNSIQQHKEDIIQKGLLITQHQDITEILPETSKDSAEKRTKREENTDSKSILDEMFPYGTEDISYTANTEISLDEVEKNKRKLLAVLRKSMPEDKIKKLNCFSMKDVDIDAPNYVNEKVMNVGFDSKEKYIDRAEKELPNKYKPYYLDEKGGSSKDGFDFDYQPDLEGHPGPSPSVILQALTMSNANDGINLERLETIGDSFLKFAITAYLYCAHPTVHEGKLSHMRSKQVSNLNLYRLGKNKRLGARMIASKFEPHDNWLPPCHIAPPTLKVEAQEQAKRAESAMGDGCFIPYNLITQHSIPDKSIADCVEALIGAYLISCGPRGALLLMCWLGIAVCPAHVIPARPPRTKTSPCPNSSRTIDCDTPSSEELECDPAHHEEFEDWQRRGVGSLLPVKHADGKWYQTVFGELKAPPSPLLRYIADPEGELEQMLSGYDALERTLQYRFKDRSLLLQSMTHASHQQNRLTDCYQRLEFLGDAILDYLITRHLFEDERRHSPGALTDLRSALVNNTIFATLAVRHGFHKYFRHNSPGLNEVLTKYVKIQEENGHSISEEHYLIQEDEMEQAEDVEVPKALGDLFESVAGAIFLDSGMSLGAVWKSYENLMGAELEAFSAAAPKSPVRELLEAEPDTAKFGKPERLADGRRVRVCVEVFGRGTFKGIGRNYRIAKGTAARCALRHLKECRAH